jgi:hypothetical protein
VGLSAVHKRRRRQQIGVLCTAIWAHKNNRNIGFKEKRQFSAENWQKSQNPDHYIDPCKSNYEENSQQRFSKITIIQFPVLNFYIRLIMCTFAIGRNQGSVIKRL